jgi:hypothetical protein
VALEDPELMFGQGWKVMPMQEVLILLPSQMRLIVKTKPKMV